MRFRDWKEAKVRHPILGEIERVSLDLRREFPDRVKDMDLDKIDFRRLTSLIEEHRTKIDLDFPGLLPPSTKKGDLVKLILLLSAIHALKQVPNAP